MDDIAIIGIGCKVPGANNIEEYWKVLANGENHIIDIPKERWNNDAFYSENKDEPGKSYVNKAGFISGYDEWDNKLFGISDSEAVRMDPQQRQVLECTHMALEDAGITRKCLKGTDTGVYLGVMNDDYKGFSTFDHDDDTNYSATGMSTTIMSARISYVYDLRGPCMVVDTACSSSMVAIHLGCQAIRTGDCDMAICGGVSSMLTPDQFITLCKARMLSPSGQCQSFSDAADGYGRGEGCGIVILKSVTQAIRDKNKIWGIVKTGSNQDGRVTQPITAPSGQQQEELLKKLYFQHGIDPNSLQYIEAHGTGTSIGDPTEINAIGRFIESCRTKLPPDKENVVTYIPDTDHSLYTLQHNLETENSKSENDSMKKEHILIGSVKSNIGHLESAAGVAALIKVLLMMKHGKFVPSLHIKKDKSNINKQINLEKYGLDISTEFADWKQNKKGERICCVNCFGFGGSNTHAIVVQKSQPKSPAQTTNDNKTDNQYQIVVVSGITKAALVSNIEALEKDLATGNHEVNDLSFTSICKRDQFPYRTFVFGTNKEDIKKQLRQKLVHADKIEIEKETRIIFVFGGVGTTWTGMCQEMMKTNIVFRKAVKEIDIILKPLTGWSIVRTFQEETDYSDPFLNHISLFCAQVALFELWKSLGICPDGIVGQSVGEVAASYASGALSLPNAVKVIYHRSQILSEMKGGKMMIVGNIEVSKIESFCQKMNNRVTIAVYNSPVSCTVSGDAEAIDQLKKELEDINKKKNLDIMIRPLAVQCAYHSSHVEPCIEQIMSKLSFLKKSNRTTNQFSTVTGELADNDEFQTGTYWADNIRKPVLFMNAITRSADAQAHNVFIEIGPRPVVRAHLNHIMGSQMKGVSLPSMSPRKETEIIYTSLSILFELGVDISWANIVPADGNIISVPRYIFQKTKLLYIPKGKRPLLRGSNVHQSDSHLYVKRNHDGKPPFLILLDKNTTMFVYDHYLYNAVIVPGATYVEAAFEIGHQMSSLNVYEICVSIEFENTYMPGKDNMCLIALELEEQGTNEFEFHVRKEGKILSKGRIFPRKKFDRKEFDIRAIISRCKMHRTKMKSYECLQNLNFRYGESLSVIEQSWASSTECVVEFVMPYSVLKHRKLTHVHPSVVDGMFQTFGILSSNGAADGPTLPKGLGSMILNRPPQRHMFGYSRLVKSSPNENHYHSFLLSPDGHVTAEISDFFTKSVVDVSDTARNMIYSAVWREAKLSPQSERDATRIKEKKVTIISSERFLTYFKNSQNSNEQLIEYIDIENDFTEEAFGCLSGSHSVVYAPFFHIGNMESDGTVMFECVKRSFLHLSEIINCLKDQNKEFPVFIVTENTMGYISRQCGSSNVCGAELWGMVRSMISEEAYHSLTLVDMTTSEENGAVLKTILDTVTYGFNEFMIENGICYIAKIQEVSKHGIPFRREINADITEDVILLSSLSTALKDMHFDIRSRKKSKRSDITKECQLNLQTFCLHSSLIFPVSQEIDCEEIVSLKESLGYPLICIEGIGQKRGTFAGNSEGNSQRVFCYPINVAAVVSVPEQCTFDFTTLPTYIPGMMTVGILLWNVVEVCKMSSNICVIVENRSEYWIHILTHFLSKSVHIQTQSVFDECTSSRNPSIRTLVILSELTNAQVDAIVKVYPSLKEIVSLEEFFPKSRKVFLKMENERIVLTTLKTEEMFMSTELTKTVPTVYNKLKSMENKTVSTGQPQAVSDQGYLGKANVFKLPYPVLPLYDENTKKPRFPLQVTQENVFRTKSCYILVGGLTGLGWELLQFMAELGVKYIAALSRSLPSRNKENDLEKVRKKYGCRVIHLQADITILSQLTYAFDKLKRGLGSDVDIRGIFHGGGVTRDKLLKNMSSSDLEAVLLPKVLGTWNLHLATKGMPLDFFTMHSSIVSIFGNQGQCNYAAGNSFQDSFANYRRHLGLPGQSINWSTLSVGMATENRELEKYLSNQGFHFLTKSEIRQCFLQAVMSNKIQIMFGRFDWHKMKENPALTKNPSKFSEILAQIPTTAEKAIEAAKTNDILELSGEPVKQKQLINEVVKSKIAEAFVVDEGKLSDTTKILTLGIDSMAAMSFTNAMYDMTKVRIPIGTVFDEFTTVEDLTTFIATRIETGLDSAKTKFEKGNDKANEYLSGNVTFMQKTLLDDFVKTPLSRNIMRQVDLEISGVTLLKNDIMIVFNHLIKTNPDLRYIYEIENDGSYHSHLLDNSETHFKIEEVVFQSICEKNSVDARDNVCIDITKEIPIRIMAAFLKDRTRIRVFLHAIVGDLSGMTLFFREIGDILKCHLQKKPLPEKNSVNNPAEAVRNSIMPRMNELRMYWNSTFKEDVHPFTFFHDLSSDLDEKYWKTISQKLPANLVERMMDFINLHGLTLYNFIMSVYMMILHERTGRNVIPLVIFVDMRSHVLQLKSVLQRCTNSIPVVCDLRNMGTVLTFLKTNSDKLNEITQHGAYPYELILDEMRSEELKLNIGRHRFVMENMTTLQNHVKHDGVEIKIGNVYYKRQVYETTLHTEYDLAQNIVILQFGYNGKALSAEEADFIIERMQELIYRFLQAPHEDIVSILQGNDKSTEHSDLVTNGFSTHDSSTNQTEVKQSTDYQMKKDLDDLGRTKEFQEMKQTVIQSTEYQMDKDLDDLGRTKEFQEMKQTVIQRTEYQMNKTLDDSGQIEDFHEMKQTNLQSTAYQMEKDLDGFGRTEDFHDMKQTVILTEKFMKQTTQGWEHSVDLKLSKKMFGSSSGEILISWGSGKKQRTINGHDILEVEVKKINEAFYFLIKTRSRLYVFKAMSSSKAMGWLNTFKRVHGEIKDLNQQELVCHL